MLANNQVLVDKSYFREEVQNELRRLFPPEQTNQQIELLAKGQSIQVFNDVFNDLTGTNVSGKYEELHGISAIQRFNAIQVERVRRKEKELWDKCGGMFGGMVEE